MNTYKVYLWVCVTVIALKMKSVMQKRCHAHRSSTGTRQSTLSHFDRSYLLDEWIISSLFRLDMLIGSPKCRLKCFEGCTCTVYNLLTVISTPCIFKLMLWFTPRMLKIPDVK